jgi:hypothetical protein
LRNQPVIGEGLAHAVPGVEGDYEEKHNDRNVIRRAEDCPKLMKIHKENLLLATDEHG